MPVRSCRGDLTIVSLREAAENPLAFRCYCGFALGAGGAHGVQVLVRSEVEGAPLRTVGSLHGFEAGAPAAFAVGLRGLDVATSIGQRAVVSWLIV